ncbi:MAG: type II toxin-antitoxin system RelE/ParE family toxin [Flavobacteriales bacterium]|nr:type II toxin-antitoxin system RelE/ParE family toxin [Flavobacteriales bacterium]
MGLKNRRSVVISRSAQKSIREIYSYIKQRESKAVAHKVRQAIIEKCRSLGEFSGYSKERYLDKLEGDYRSVTIWDYNIIYRVSKDEVRVLIVIHTSRHPDRRSDFYP